MEKDMDLVKNYIIKAFLASGVEINEFVCLVQGVLSSISKDVFLPKTAVKELVEEVTEAVISLKPGGRNNIRKSEIAAQLLDSIKRHDLGIELEEAKKIKKLLNEFRIL
jgi:hypothetical protein